jgi:hypothetical protein
VVLDGTDARHLAYRLDISLAHQVARHNAPEVERLTLVFTSSSAASNTVASFDIDVTSLDITSLARIVSLPGEDAMKVVRSPLLDISQSRRCGSWLR